jgi:ABC-type branched-subunit amino acid transport system ATPase component
MLEIDGLTVRFDGIKALCGVSFKAPLGARIGVIGPNGSGKTTLFNAISGLVAVASGTIRLGDTSISRLPPHQVAAAGVARTFQTVRLFDRLSVLDNALPTTGADDDAALAALDLVGLGARRGALAGDLSFYERRRLEIARVIAQRPRLVLADEPTAGLSHSESDHVIELMSRAFDATTIILLIEHRIDAVETLCPRALLLAEGLLVADAATTDMRRDARLASVYFGSRLAP